MLIATALLAYLSVTAEADQAAAFNGFQTGGFFETPSSASSPSYSTPSSSSSSYSAPASSYAAPAPSYSAPPAPSSSYPAPSPSTYTPPSPKYQKKYFFKMYFHHDRFSIVPVIFIKKSPDYQGFGSGVLPGSGSGSGFPLSLDPDPDPVSAPGSRNKKIE